MPGGGGSSNPTRSPARGQPDIRHFLSPPRPPRNRRIIESDSSDQNNQNGGAAIPAGLQPQQPQRAVGQENEHPQPEHNPSADTQGNAPPPLIDISDSDSSDSMYIPQMRSRTAEAPRDHQHEDQHQRILTPQRQRQSTPQRQRPPTPRQQNQTTPPSQRQRQPSSRRQSQRTPQHQRQLSAQDQRNRLTGEAESTSEDESDQLSADESCDDAAALYRSAIMGVRNRPNATQQVKLARRYADHSLTAADSFEQPRIHAQFAQNSMSFSDIFNNKCIHISENQSRGLPHYHDFIIRQLLHTCHNNKQRSCCKDNGNHQ
jgi:hypothetical protein